MSRHASVLTRVTCTGAILGLLGASPVVVRRAAAGSINSRVWENFPPPPPQQRREGKLWADWEQLVLDGLHCVSSRHWGSSPARVRATLLPGGASRPGVRSTRLGRGLCGRGLKAALPEFTLHGRYTLTELSFYLQTEQLYWKRFSKHGTAQCYVY